MPFRKNIHQKDNLVDIFDDESRYDVYMYYILTY